VLASLNTTCPKCGFAITPDQVKRVDFERMECPKCGEKFSPTAETCPYSEPPFGKFTNDHIFPDFLGGRKSIRVCRDCNSGFGHSFEAKAAAQIKRMQVFVSHSGLDLSRAPATWPADKLSFASGAQFRNTLQVHLEWKGENPHAIIQPITGHELMIAMAWIDVIRGGPFHVCQRKDCGIPFTGRTQKYCDWYCGHIEAVRASRERKRKKQRAAHRRRNSTT
jgi:hypothetical protein